MSTYLWFAFILIVVSIALPLILSLFAIPLGLAVLGIQKNADKQGKKPNSFLLGMVFLLSLYVLGGWAAWAALWTKLYSLAPGVIHPWLYYATGFTVFYGATAKMVLTNESPTGTISFICAAIAFIVFLIWPNIAFFPYGWLLNMLF